MLFAIAGLLDSRRFIRTYRRGGYRAVHGNAVIEFGM